MRTVLIVQARMGSTRLPGKCLMPLSGIPMLTHILRRLRKCNEVDEFVLAIPDTVENLVLKEFAQKEHFKIFVGSELDVLSRYHSAAIEHCADLVCRFPADNPVPSSELIDSLILFHKKFNKEGFSSNLAEVLGSGFPDGLGAEIFSIELLQKAVENNFSSNLREHPHLNFYDYSSGQPTNYFSCPVKSPPCKEWMQRPDIRLDVNVKEDYDLMQRLFDSLYPSKNFFGPQEIIHWWDNRNAKGEKS